MHSTRSAQNLHINYKRTNYGRFSVKYIGALVWNSLPTTLKEIKSPHMFKRQLKDFVQRATV